MRYKQDKTCPECGKSGLSPQGLSGHLRMVHSKKQVLISALSTTIASLAQANTDSSKINSVPVSAESPPRLSTENAADSGEIEQKSNSERYERTCPGCIARENRIIDIKNEIKIAQKRAEELETEAEERSQQEQTAAVPSVADFIEHCESGNCQHHAQGWQAVKERITKAAIENVDPFLLSDKVVEAEALKRGFIPTRIVIPNRYHR